ncbi:hypothetical protein WA158_002119 [Blastocystis sp. Blastoise]
MDVFHKLCDALDSFDTNTRTISSCLSSLSKDSEKQKQILSLALKDEINQYLNIQLEKFNNKKTLVDRYYQNVSSLTTQIISDLDNCEKKKKELVEKYTKEAGEMTVGFLSSLDSFDDNESLALFLNIKNDILNVLALDKPVDAMNTSAMLTNQQIVPSFVGNNSQETYCIVKDILYKYPGTYFAELIQDPCSLDSNGNYYIDYPSDYINLMVHYMNEDPIDYESFNEEQAIQVSKAFSFFRLPYRDELLTLGKKAKGYTVVTEWLNSMIINVNGKNDLLLTHYMNENKLLIPFFQKQKYGDIEFNHEETAIKISIKLKFQDIFHTFIRTGNINTISLSYTDTKLFLKEASYLDIYIPKNQQVFKGSIVFPESSIITTAMYDKYILKWFVKGSTLFEKNKKWKMVATEQTFDEYYTVKSQYDLDDSICIFKVYCNQIECIFGRYIQKGTIKVPVEDTYVTKTHYDVYLFTLENARDVPPIIYKRLDKTTSIDEAMIPSTLDGGIHITYRCDTNENSRIENDGNIYQPPRSWDPKYTPALFVTAKDDVKNDMFKVAEIEMYIRDMEE